jgi:hypothetical protein
MHIEKEMNNKAHGFSLSEAKLQSIKTNFKPS